MASFNLPEQLHGSAVKFSPLQPDLLAVTATQTYGSHGNGSVFILETDTRFSSVLENRCFEWTDGLVDIAWSKNNPDIVLTSSLDGSLQLWNIHSAENDKEKQILPLQIFKEHKAEVQSIDWTSINENPQILSGSWDQTIKLWDPNRLNSLITYTDPFCSNKNHLIFSVCFSGSQRNIFCSVGSDGALKIWSMNETLPVGDVQLSFGEVMSCAWSKCDENLIVSGDSEGVIKVHDIRSLTSPVSEMCQKEKVAIKKVAFSTLTREHIASVGYDGLTR